jgi:hypothetical protein
MENFSLMFVSVMFVFFIVAYVFAIFLVFLSALLAPYIFRIARYEVTYPHKITASEATGYTLQALIAVVVGLLVVWFNLIK